MCGLGVGGEAPLVWTLLDHQKELRERERERETSFCRSRSLGRVVRDEWDERRTRRRRRKEKRERADDWLIVAYCFLSSFDLLEHPVLVGIVGVSSLLWALESEPLVLVIWKISSHKCLSFQCTCKVEITLRKKKEESGKTNGGLLARLIIKEHHHHLHHLNRKKLRFVKHLSQVPNPILDKVSCIYNLWIHHSKEISSCICAAACFRSLQCLCHTLCPRVRNYTTTSDLFYRIA